LDDGTNVAIGEVYPATKFFEFPTIASSQLHECIKDSGAEKLALKEALVKRYRSYMASLTFFGLRLLIPCNDL
jgi:hypothetical protein